MGINTSFGHLVDGKIVYARNPELINGAVVYNPTAAMYLGLNPAERALNLAYPTDPAGDGKHWEEDGFEETDTTIAKKWKAVEDVKVYRQFSKLKIYGAIAQLGAWSTIQTWLEGKTINGLNGWLAFTLAQEISENHEMFTALAEEARQLLGLSTEQFETLLNQCLLEGAY